MLMSLVELKSEKGCAGDALQKKKMKTIDPTYRQREPYINKPATV
jgi:hypothetical protein